MRLAMQCSVSISDLVGAIEMAKQQCIDIWKETVEEDNEESSNKDKKFFIDHKGINYKGISLN